MWGDSFALCAVFAAATALLFALWRLRRISLRQYWALFFLAIFGTAIWGIIWWRETAALRALSEMVDVPQSSDVSAPPNALEAKLIMRALAKSPAPGAFISQQDREDLAKSVESMRDYSMWVIESPLSPAEVHFFYESEAHHKGWQVVQDAESAILLGQDEKLMMIGFGASKSGKGTTITYFMTPARKTASD